MIECFLNVCITGVYLVECVVVEYVLCSDAVNVSEVPLMDSVSREAATSRLL